MKRLVDALTAHLAEAERARLAVVAEAKAETNAIVRRLLLRLEAVHASKNDLIVLLRDELVHAAADFDQWRADCETALRAELAQAIAAATAAAPVEAIATVPAPVAVEAGPVQTSPAGASTVEGAPSVKRRKRIPRQSGPLVADLQLAAPVAVQPPALEGRPAIPAMQNGHHPKESS